jgi:hypothetical protein
MMMIMAFDEMRVRSGLALWLRIQEFQRRKYATEIAQERAWSKASFSAFDVWDLWSLTDVDRAEIMRRWREQRRQGLVESEDQP